MAKILGKLLAAEEGNKWLKDIESGVVELVYLLMTAVRCLTKVRVYFGSQLKGAVHHGEEVTTAGASAVGNRKELNTLTHLAFSLYSVLDSSPCNAAAHIQSGSSTLTKPI